MEQEAGDLVAIDAVRLHVTLIHPDTSSRTIFDREMPLESGAILYRDAPNVVRPSRPLFPAT
jgi:hypothetical protein